jgi:hypothetical protein
MNFLHLFHDRMRRLHGGGAADTPAPGEGFAACYDDYARAVADANAILRQHGPQSVQFAAADIASMRLFHRVKKMQGLKKPRAASN